MGETSRLSLPYPELNETGDVPRDLKDLAESLDVLGYVPVGAMMMWATDTAPIRWLLCTGQTDIPAATWPLLAAVLGSTGGMINMPNLAQRLPIGAGAGYALGASGGAAAVTLNAAQSGMPAHGHADTLAVANAGAIQTGSESADHSHIYSRQSAAGAAVQGQAGGVSVARAGLYDSVGGGGRSVAHTHTVPTHGHVLNGAVNDAAARDASASHENMPPFRVVNFIIRAG